MENIQYNTELESMDMERAFTLQDNANIKYLAHHFNSKHLRYNPHNFDYYTMYYHNAHYFYYQEKGYYNI